MKERLMFQNAPHVRRSESVTTMMTDVIVALIPIYLMSFFFHGARAIALGVFGVLCCTAFSVIGNLVLKQKQSFDITPAITGLIIPLLMPATVPYYIIACACAVAIFVVKMPFGGTGNNLFNLAAVGFASVAICWPDIIFTYPATMQPLKIFGETAVNMVQSPAYSLNLGAIPNYGVLDMLLGSAPGPMGATNILVVIACGIYLMVRKTINWIEPISFLGTYILLCLTFPRISASPLEAVCYELFSGTIIFGAFFMLTEPVTSPKRDISKFLAGITSAVAVFLFRHFGKFEMGFASALIIMNVISPIYDEIYEQILHVLRHKKDIFDSFKKEPESEAAAAAVTEKVSEEEQKEVFTIEGKALEGKEEPVLAKEPDLIQEESAKEADL